jgi:hypothetical protein
MKPVSGKTAVLIVASSYDTGTFYTSQWARALHEDLVTQGHTALFLPTESLCRSDSSFVDATSAVGCVVFYGNGTTDQWSAIPGAPDASAVPLVDVNTVDRFAGRRIYAGCSYSLVNLGSAYARKFPHGQYVGYRDEFSFEVTNRNLFRDVVNASIAGFINGTPAAEVHAELKTAWERLRDDFLPPGPYSQIRNAVMASQRAADNAEHVGHQPPQQHK